MHVMGTNFSDGAIHMFYASEYLLSVFQNKIVCVNLFTQSHCGDLTSL